MYHEIVLIGVAVSLLFTELTGFSPAGLIVPGYIVLCLQTPVQNCLYAGDRTLGMGRRQTVGKFHDFIWPTALCCDDFIGVYHDLIIASSEILPYDPGIIGVLVPGIIANEWNGRER